MRVVPGYPIPGPGEAGPDTAPLSRERQETWARARRMLAVRLDGMGDLVMTMPALRALKGGGGTDAPERDLTLLTSPEGAQAAELFPGLDRTVSYRAPWMKPEPEGGPSVDLELIERLRELEFDAAVIFTVYSQNPLPAALTTYLAGIPLRLAYCRENPYNLLTDRLPEQEPDEGVRHEVRRHLDLVAATGARQGDERIRLEPRAGARARVSDLTNDLGLSGHDRWLVVHAGASAPSRRYPPEYFAMALAELVREHGLTPVFTGSPGETELVAGIREQLARLADDPGVDLSGQLDLHELTALLERSPLLLSNNTGPVHLAAGVGTPVVDLYALTNPQHTPWGVPSEVLYHDVSCRFCYSSVCPEVHHACLAGVPPAQVSEAVTRLLREPSPHSEGAQHAAVG